MRNDGSNSGRKSLKSDAPLRSRGFLSQPGGHSPHQRDSDGKPNMSRGKRQPIVNSNGKPADLATKAAVRPYTLEEE